MLQSTLLVKTEYIEKIEQNFIIVIYLRIRKKIYILINNICQ